MQASGAKLFFEKGIEADAFLQQYHTEYNKVYSRRYRAAGKYAEEHSGKDLAEEEFKAWSVAASLVRRDYVEGKHPRSLDSDRTQGNSRAKALRL